MRAESVDPTPASSRAKQSKSRRGIASRETWRFFAVLDRGGRAVFGAEPPGLENILFKDERRDLTFDG